MDMIKKNKVILTDCDGVCLDWEFGFHTWMDTHKHKLQNKNFLLHHKMHEE